MPKTARLSFLIAALALAGTFVFAGAGKSGSVDAQRQGQQRILGPGTYVYQTRLDNATCQDNSTSGFVTSYFAAIDGIPGAWEMQMNLLNSEFWPEWTITVRDGTIVGDATMRGRSGNAAPRSHFEVTRDGDQFEGRGWREYTMTTNGVSRRCRNEFDVLLRQLR